MCIQFQENKQKDCKPPKCRSPIAKKWKRYTYHWEKANGHANIDGKVKKENADHTESVGSGKSAFLTFGDEDGPQE